MWTPGQFMHIQHSGQRPRVRMINDEIIDDYGTGKPAAAKRRVSYQCIYRYAVTHQVELIYVRSFHNANPFTIRLFSKLRKAGIKIAMEIPTYPYDSEYTVSTDHTPGDTSG